MSDESRPRVVGFIPIRLNSKRIPEKSIKPLAGKPLLHYNLRAMLSANLDEICVFCSDVALGKYLLPGVRLILRDPALDRDETRGIEIWHAFAAAVPADVVVQSHATAPFIRPESIRRGISAVVDEGNDSACSAREIRTYCWYLDKPLNFHREGIIPTQLLDPVWEETGGFYVWRSEVLSSTNSRIGLKHKLIRVDEIEAVDIDEADDFDLAEKVARGLVEQGYDGRRET